MAIRVGVFVVVVALGLWLFALADAATSPGDRVRTLPKSLWILVTLLLPVVGSAAWLTVGRPKAVATLPSGAAGSSASVPRPGLRPARRAPVAPDDDPEFLKGLAERLRDPRDDDPGGGSDGPQVR